MEERYDSYCAVDPLFYDALTNTKARTAEYGEQLRLPDGWKRAVQNDWLVIGPDEDPLPAQGWKVHISARRFDAPRCSHSSGATAPPAASASSSSAGRRCC